MDRGRFRGPRGARGGGGATRGGSSSHQNSSSGSQQQGSERPKKENILDLQRFLNKEIKVKFNGGREVIGTLKGFDQLMNLVLDDVKEVMRDDKGNEATRSLGLIVARGTLLVVISPVEGSEIIANPFVNQEDE